MKTKTFDCVEMKHKAGQRIYEQLKGKTVEEQIDFWRKVEEKYRNRQRNPRAATSG
ncbi:MAG: hypothetical protein HUU16_04460 [Candidatus Omnitrophica bacterium]|nr:hypothetical protein [bacterium]NUN95403.1 hypothetical protein [Candidatus Omnitrophota bacterium]